MDEVYSKNCMAYKETPLQSLVPLDEQHRRGDFKEEEDVMLH